MAGDGFLSPKFGGKNHDLAQCKEVNLAMKTQRQSLRRNLSVAPSVDETRMISNNRSDH